MRASLRGARPWATAVAVSLFLVACGDDDPSAPRFTERTANEVADVAEHVTSPMEASTQVQINLFNAYMALTGGLGGPLSPMQPFEAMGRVRAPFGAARPMAAPTGATGVLIPAEAEGTTFVWNTGEAMYVPSDLAGAPANGVRFLWYAVDPFSGEPVEPLNALGHIDLIDESTEAEARLVVQVVRDADDETLADYFVEGAVTGNLVTTTVTIDSEGFFSDGTDQLDFDMRMVFTSSETSGGQRLLVELDGDGGSIDMDIEETYDAAGSDVEGTFTVAGGGIRAVFEFTGASTDVSSTIDGSLSFNGDEVVIFSGEAGEPEFTRPDGSALTSSEIEALGRIWMAFGVTYIFVFQALFPFLLLMAFTGF